MREHLPSRWLLGFGLFLLCLLSGGEGVVYGQDSSFDLSQEVLQALREHGDFPQEVWERDLFSLGNWEDRGQVIKTAERQDFRAAFDHLGANNDVKGLRNWLRSQRQFIERVNASQYSILYKTEDAQAGILLDGEVNLWHGLDVFGVVQTNRPSGYLKESFSDAYAQDIPKWQVFNLIFANNLPPGLEHSLDAAGEAPEDYFCLYFLPSHMDWAVGEKLPLLPLPLPRSLFEKEGYQLEDLDFHNVRVVLLEEALQMAREYGDPELENQAGVHIGVKGSNQELFLSLEKLSVAQQALDGLYRAEVVRNNIRNQEELFSVLNTLEEDQILQTYRSLQQLNDMNPASAVVLKEALIGTSWIPSQERARSLRPSTRGPFSVVLRSIFRLSERIPSSRPNSSAEEQAKREEYREMIENYLEELRRRPPESLKTFIELQQREERTPFPSEVEGDRASEKQNFKSKLKRKLRHLKWGIFFGPLAVFGLVGGSDFVAEFDRIFPFYIGAAGLSSAALLGYLRYVFLRNVTIRDIEAERHRDAQDSEDFPHELDKLKQQVSEIDSRLYPGEEGERLSWRQRRALQAKRLWINFKQTLIERHYRRESLEQRKAKWQENGEKPDERGALEFFNYKMFSFFHLLHAWPRGLVRLVFPHYYKTREAGGEGNFQDGGLRLSVSHVLRFAWYSLILGYSYKGVLEEDREKQKLSRREYQLVEPAVYQALRRLSVRKALELGVRPELIEGIFSIDILLNERGEEGFQILNRRLLEFEEISEEDARALNRYLQKLYSIVVKKEFRNNARQKARELLGDLASQEEDVDESRRMELAEQLSSVLQSELEKRVKEELVSSRTQSLLESTRLGIAQRRYQLHSGFWLRGKAAKNLAPIKAMQNLHRYSRMHLVDRLMISGQIWPIMAMRGFEEGMDDEQLFNAIGAQILYLFPENMAAYAGGISVNSKLIDQLLEFRGQNPKIGYFASIGKNLPRLPYKAMALQVATKMDLRMLSAVSSAAIFVGLMLPLDTFLTLQGVEELVFSEILRKGAENFGGRVANGVAGAIVNFGFSTFSTPLMTGLMTLRVMSGGKGTNGHKTAQFFKADRGTEDRIFFGSAQLVLNSLYALTAATWIPYLSSVQTERFNFDLSSPLEPAEPGDLVNAESARELVGPGGEALSAEANLKPQVFSEAQQQEIQENYERMKIQNLHPCGEMLAQMNR